MGIKGFFKWLCHEFPECIIHDKNVYSHCQTLFIDVFQLRFKSFDFIQKKMKDKSPKEQIQYVVTNLKKLLKNVILTINPHEQIFVFHDGPSPAIKFQRQRERCFKSEHIDNYIIDSTEYKLSDINIDTNELVNEALFEFFQEMTHNCKYLRAKEIFYSSFYAPGEAEHKYFEIFRDQKKSSKWRLNQLHTIYSTDNDLILLPLQFLDEHFLVIRDENTIVDISIFRDLLLFELFHKNITFSMHNDQIKNRVEIARNISAHIPTTLKQQVVNDIIALSFIIGCDYIPPIPDQKSQLSFTALLNAYKKINQEFFNSVISIDGDKPKSVTFTPLIVNDTFSVASLQKIISECFTTKSGNDILSKNTNDIISKNTNDNDSNNANDNDSKNTNDNDSKNTNDNDSSNANDNDSKSTNDDDYQKVFDNKNNEKMLNFLSPIEKISEDNDSNSKNTQSHDNSDLSLQRQQAQHMLRVFNFTWLYYSRRCPSWTYYFPFKDSLPLHEAVQMMIDEGPAVFNTPGSTDKMEPMFNTFVVFPVDSREDLPWCLYRLKIPPSEIAHFWPLGATEVEDIPMLDLSVMKKFYDEAKKQISKDELKYNRSDEMYHLFYNNNVRKKCTTTNKKYYRH